MISIARKVNISIKVNKVHLLLYITFLTNWKKFFNNIQNWMKTKFTTAMKMGFQQTKQGVELSVLWGKQNVKTLLYWWYVVLVALRVIHL